MSPAVTAKLVEVLDSSFLRALAEPSRLEILKVLLERGPSDVGTVAAYVPQERSVVSRHLKVLLDAQIVTSARRGRHRVLAVDGQAILVRFERILALARSVAAVCCPPGATLTLADRASGARPPRRGPRRRGGAGGLRTSDPARPRSHRAVPARDGHADPVHDLSRLPRTQ